MALVKATLEQGIVSALKLALPNPNAEQTKEMNDLANALATAIDSFVKSAQVNPGIPVATTGSATAQTGATTAPGSLS